MTERSHDGLKMEDTVIPWRTAAVSLGSVIIVGVVVLFLELLGAPTRRGFFCHDDTIKYPYKANTVSEAAIVLAAVLLPLILIVLTEFWSSGRSSPAKVRLCRLSVPRWLNTAVVMFGGYLLGLGLSQILSGVGKFSTGRLRPHFLAVCAPDVSCDTLQPPGGYLLNYTCTGEPTQVIEARLSFPSGHASLAFFACVYLTMYLQRSSKWAQYRFARGGLQFALVLSAWWVSLSRVSDNWHHWSDVLAGAILGATAAYITIGCQQVPELGPPAQELLPLKRTSQPDNNHFSS